MWETVKLPEGIECMNCSIRLTQQTKYGSLSYSCANVNIVYGYSFFISLFSI